MVCLHSHSLVCHTLLKLDVPHLATSWITIPAITGISSKPTRKHVRFEDRKQDFFGFRGLWEPQPLNDCVEPFTIGRFRR